MEIDYLHDSAEYVKTKNKKTLIKVDEVAAEEIKNTELHENYTLLMTKVDIGNGYYSQNVFYKMQILHEYN